MKQIFIILISLFYISASLCTAFANDKVIVNPVYDFSKTGVTHITKIELGKNETRLYIQTIFYNINQFIVCIGKPFYGSR